MKRGPFEHVWLFSGITGGVVVGTYAFMTTHLTDAWWGGMVFGVAAFFFGWLGREARIRDADLEVERPKVSQGPVSRFTKEVAR